MTDRQAWYCPSCQKHHAPHCDSCPALPNFSHSHPTPYFGPGSNSHPGYDPCANCKGPCGNVACPRLARGTCGVILDGQATTGAN